MAIGDALTSRDQLYGRNSVDLLARTLYGETENDSDSRVGVAWVVLNRKNATTGEFRNQNSIEAVVLHKNAFSCFWDSNLAKCLKPNTSSQVWKNCVSVAQNVASLENPFGDKLFYTQIDLFNANSKTENGKLLYKMSGAWVVVTSKTLKGQHMFFNYSNQ
ncbi:cell wall hydrolase (plasmid) [Paenibacillus sonchi]|uniref:Cell wall hydrolase n=1 Tax=Paenibacillus sonchi TaxID=373687 RepID=A0A974SG09_9BACL|nr:cell wall hydrolase [Paenibacillus sonchi]QQZ64557.1 cell wall hydrolase [Paenibacillus sonchi]